MALPEHLLSRLKPILSKRAGLALALWGEPGIGKTFTVQKLLLETPCRSYSLHAAAPLTAWLKALPQPAKLPFWAETLVQRLGKGEYIDPGSVADALVALLAALAPVLLHLEDMHEASPEQVERIATLAARVARNKGVALLVTSRTQPPLPFEAQHLQLLSSQAARGLLESQVGAILPTQASEWIYTKARGNPLFTLEYFRHLARMGFLWNDSQRWHWRTPPADLMPVTVEALIEQQILEVSQVEATRKALEAKALLPEASDHLWAKLADLGVDELEQAKLQLLERGVLQEGEFSHPLFREVRLLSLRPERKQALARRALEAMKDDPEMAVSFVHDAGLQPSQALELLRRAAEASKRRGNQVQAARFLAQTVAYATGEEKGRLALEAARGLRHVDIREADRLAKLAASVPSLTKEGVLLSAELLAIQGRLVEAEQLLESLLIVDVGWSRVQQLALRAMARDYAGAVELWRQNPELQSNNDPLILRAAIRALLGNHNLAETKGVLARALALSNLSQQDRVSFENLEVSYLLRAGEAEQAAAILAERIPRLPSDIGIRDKALALHLQGIALERLGQYKEAIPILQKTAQLYAEVGDMRSFALAHQTVAWELWHLGDYRSSEAILLESRSILENSELSDLLVECEGYLCLLYLDWSAPLAVTLARKHGDNALQIARRINNSYEIVASLYDNVMVKLRQNKIAEAQAYVHEMFMLINTNNLDGLFTNALYCQSLILEAQDQKEQAIQLMQEAKLINEKKGTQIYTRKIGLEIARLSNDVDLAREHLGWFKERGLMNGVNIALRYFPQLADGTLQVNFEPQHLSRLEVLGSIQLRSNSQTSPIRGQKRKELLAALVEARIAGGSEVGILHLLEALYPGVPEPEAEALLRQLVFQIRSSLGQEVILTTSGGYALGAVDSDAELFLRNKDTALWRGSYLADLEGEADESVWQALYQALANRGQTLLQTNPKEAARVGKLLLGADPYNSEYLGLALQALRASNQHKTLTRLYQQAKERFLEVGQTLPESWQTYLSVTTV